MRREELASLIVYLLMIALAVIVGLTAVKDALSVCRPANMNPFLFVIITIVVGLLFNIIMLEVLHAIGGKLGGYRVTYINIFYFGFEKIQKAIAKWEKSCGKHPTQKPLEVLERIILASTNENDLILDPLLMKKNQKMTLLQHFRQSHKT